MCNPVIQFWLIQFDEQNLVKDVEGTNTKEDMVPGIEDIVMESIN